MPWCDLPTAPHNSALCRPLKLGLSASATLTKMKRTSSSFIKQFQYHVKAFQLFTDIEPDADRMLRSFGSGAPAG